MRRVALTTLSLALPLLGTPAAFGAPKVKRAAAPPAATKPAPAPPADIPPPDFRAWAKDASERSVELLQKSTATFTAKRKCLSCHHQSLTAMAVKVGRDAGIKVDQAAAAQEEKLLKGMLAEISPLLRAARSDEAAEKQVDFALVDPAQTGGYVIAQMEAAGYPKDAAAADLAYYLGKKQLPDGRWTHFGARPPQTSSDFTSTALAINGIRHYGAEADAEVLQARVAKGREWLTTAKSRTNEDRAFRLLGLKWAGADSAAIQNAAEELLDQQHDTGGWSQLQGMEPDAYATATALVALRESGAIAVKHPVYMRGIFYLIARQQRDGSWHVATRAHPVQPYFESGFPHGKDQFISAAATAWAAMALIPGIEAIPAAPPPPPARTAAR
jgi:hypothetical protein